MPLPVEFVIIGIPLSSQARPVSRARWQATVRAAAIVAWGNDAPVGDSNLELLVAYFHDAVGGNIDNDNMVKPVQDALNGVVYVDDRQLTDTRLLRRPLADVKLMAPSPDVAGAIAVGSDFILVRVRTRTEDVDLS